MNFSGQGNKQFLQDLRAQSDAILVEQGSLHHNVGVTNANSPFMQVFSFPIDHTDFHDTLREGLLKTGARSLPSALAVHRRPSAQHRTDKRAGS